MKKSWMLVFAVILLVLYIALDSVLNPRMKYEFNGQIYHSVEEVLEVAAELEGDGATARTVEVGCGPRMTDDVIVRGHYDFRYDIMVCYTDNAVGDALYEANRTLEAVHRGEVDARE